MSKSTRQVRLDTGPRRRAAAAAPTLAVSPPLQTLGRLARLRQAAFAAALVAAVVYTGQQRRPTGPSAGSLDVRIVASSVAADQPARLKIGTYNIHGGKGTDGRRDLRRIAGILDGLDFVGLNELHGPGLFESENQATTLARELRMTELFAPAEERWWHAQFGNGFLAKLDVMSWQVVPLARTFGKSCRNLIHVRARAANGAPLNIVVTHIDRSDDRERHAQLRTVADFFVSLEAPAVLLGDLNSDPSDPEIARILEHEGVVDALGRMKGFQTPSHIDWIFTRGVDVADAGLTPAGPSDHPHVWAELIVSPAR
jgi:endonuclease/exonuclease/phosphatase family metal-dependent hydrolase